MSDQDNVATSSDLNPVSRKVLQFVWCVNLDLFVRCLWPVAFAKFDVGPGASHCLQHYDDSLVGRLLVEAFFAARSEQYHDVGPVKT
jgi:hypothetical protein